MTAPTAAELAADMAAKRYTVRPLRALVPYARNSRTHSPQQIAMLKAMLMEYGWTRPVAMADNVILAGHGITIAALELAGEGKCPPGWPDPQSAPVVDLSHLTADQRRAYVIADNKAAEASGWDKEVLALEFGDLRDAGFDLSLTGFDDRSMLGMFGETTKVEIRELDTSDVADAFFVTVSGPLAQQAEALQMIRQLMRDLPGVTVDLGTINRDG